MPQLVHSVGCRQERGGNRFWRKKIAGTRAGVQCQKKSGIRIAFLGIEIHMAREWWQKKKWHTYCISGHRNPYGSRVVTIDFAFLHTSQHFWEAIFQFLHTLQHC